MGSHNSTSKEVQMLKSPPPQNIPTLPKKHNPFKVNVAIDFGTYASGLAFAFNNQVINKVWKSNKHKTKTSILLDENNDVVTFGDEAKATYESMSGNSKLKDNLKLFERFKMALYGERNDESSQCMSNNRKTVDIADELIAANGQSVSSELVFVAAFKHLADKAKKYLKSKIKEDITNSDIQWIITVPAIWNDKAKDKMNEWMIKSGLITFANQCKIVYEPDCAALTIHHYIDKKKIQNLSEESQETDEEIFVCSTPSNDTDLEDEKYEKDEFLKGEKYILIDAGGGTVDMVYHEILAHFAVREIHHPTGDKWGSCYIDDEYIKLLEKLFSKQWIDEFKQQQPHCFTAVITNFQKAKSKFFEDSSAKENICKLPEEFVQFLEEKCILNDCKLDSKFDGEEGICLIDDELIIPVLIWKKLFDFVIDKIILKIREIWNSNEHIFQNKCKYLCLVGGFACSKYLRFKMESAFGNNTKYKLHLIVPDDPTTAVVEGAAYFASNNNFVTARRLKLTYGCHANIPLYKAKEWGVPLQHIEKYKFERGSKGIWVGNCFVILARKNEEIKTGEIRSKNFHKTKPNQRFSYHYILSSNYENPKILNDGEILAKVKIDWFKRKGFSDCDAVMQFHFFDTLFQVQWYRMSDPNNIHDSLMSYSYSYNDQNDNNHNHNNYNNDVEDLYTCSLD